METYYLIIVGILFILAISDLIVGVSNDAVNFLNSAIGAKVASFKLIMFIAGIGVFVGATFSSGMMEVARKGIFNPQYFYFSEIMVIFIAVMITDVILLDGFNTLGMPTSTTVSIVFELLGAAVAISFLKIWKDPNALQLQEYINTAKAIAIISGILLSVVVSFSVGLLTQFVARLIFSFNYAKKVKYLGSIFGGVAIAAITYFMLIKGVNGASFMTTEVKDWIKEHGLSILVFSFIVWTILLQLLYWLFKINVFKIIVLVGTFALAMAFAGNDLVNFIGVPLAGFESYKAFAANPGANPDAMGMAFLAGKIKTDTYLLILAGLIMVVTLATSRKAKKVVKTSLDLSRQDEGEERFGSSVLARSIVRVSRKLSTFSEILIPTRISVWMDKQFDQTGYNEKISNMEDPPAFDLIRASINLVVASILIAIATSYKLPLSTTYVTFMVAMGTSLADKAWGRESAVYRVTGVISVIGGWFLTALIAFTCAFIMANIIAWGGAWSIAALSIFSGVIIFRTQRHQRLQTEELQAKKEKVAKLSPEEKITADCVSHVVESMEQIRTIYRDSLLATIDEDLKSLKKVQKKSRHLLSKIEELKKQVYFGLPQTKTVSVERDLMHYNVTDLLWEEALAVRRLVTPLYEHIDNNHKTFIKVQIEEIEELTAAIEKFFVVSILITKEKNFEHLKELNAEYQDLHQLIKKIRVNQLKRIKSKKWGTKISLLYSDMLHETISIVDFTYKLVSVYEEFVKGLPK